MKLNLNKIVSDLNNDPKSLIVDQNEKISNNIQKYLESPEKQQQPRQQIRALTNFLNKNQKKQSIIIKQQEMMSQFGYRDQRQSVPESKIIGKVDKRKIKLNQMSFIQQVKNVQNRYQYNFNTDDFNFKDIVNDFKANKQQYIQDLKYGRYDHFKNEQYLSKKSNLKEFVRHCYKKFYQWQKSKIIFKQQVVQGSSMIFSEDGMQLYVSHKNGVKVFDASQNFKLIGQILMNGIIFNSICQPINDKYLVAGCSDSTLKIWDLNTYQLVETLYGHTLAIQIVVSCNETRILATGSLDHTIRIWDSEIFLCQAELIGHVDAVNSLVFIKNGKKLVSGGADCQVNFKYQNIKIWNLQKNQIEQFMIGHSDEITDMVVTKDFSTLLSVSKDTRVIAWDLKQSKIIFDLKAHSAAINSISISHDDAYFITCSASGNIKQWQMKNFVLDRNLYLDSSSVLFSKFSSTQNLFATLHANDQLVIWSSEVYKINKTLSNDKTRVSCMAFSENLNYLYVGKIDGSINIYDSDKLILIEKQKQHNNAIVEISCHSIIYISACVNGVINIWQTKTSKLLFSLNNEYGISCVTLTNDALNILVGYEMSEIKLISVKSKQVLQSLFEHDECVNQIICHQSNMYCLSCSNDTTIKLWDIQSPTKQEQKRCIFTFQGHKFGYENQIIIKRVNTICFNEYQDKFFSGGLDKTIILWNIKNQQIEIKFDILEAAINQIQIIVKENMLLITLENKQVNFWNLDNYQQETFEIFSKTQNSNFQFAVANGNYLVLYDSNNDLIAYTFDQIKFVKLQIYLSTIDQDWQNLSLIDKEKFNPYNSQQFTYYGLTILHILCYLEDDIKIQQYLEYMSKHQLYFHMSLDYFGKSPLDIAKDSKYIQFMVNYLKEVKWPNQLCNCCAQAFSNFLPQVMNTEIKQVFNIFKKIIRPIMTNINVKFPTNNKKKIAILSDSKYLTEQQISQHIYLKPPNPIIAFIQSIVENFFKIKKSKVHVEQHSYQVSYIQLANIDKINTTTLQMIKQLINLGEFDDIIESKFVDTLLLYFQEIYFNSSLSLYFEILFFVSLNLQEVWLIPSMKQNLWCEKIPLPDINYSHICYPHYYICDEYNNSVQAGKAFQECVKSHLNNNISITYTFLLTIQILTSLLCLYFICLRIEQIKYGTERFVHSIKIIFYCIVIYVMFFLSPKVVKSEYDDSFNDGGVSIQKSIFILLLWLNTIDQMRANKFFMKFAFLLRVLSNSFKDLKWFMILISYSSITFTLAFFVIQDQPQDRNLFSIFKYVLYFFLGQSQDTVMLANEYNSYNHYLLGSLFFIIGFYNTIFLLNTMIAIISVSYENACRDEKQIYNYDNLKLLQENFIKDYNKQIGKKQQYSHQNWLILIEKLDYKQVTPSESQKYKKNLQKIFNRSKKTLQTTIQSEQQIQKIQSKVNNIDIIVNEKIINLNDQLIELQYLTQKQK